MRIRCAVLTFLAVVLGAAAISPARGADVAVFREPGFPYYIASPEAGPDFAAQCLRSAGIPCDFVDAAFSYGSVPAFWPRTEGHTG